MSVTVNAERINDRIKLIRHRLIARRLAVDPTLVDRAKLRVREALTSGQALECTYEWDRLLRQDISTVRRAIVSRSEEMDRLRLSSPLAAVLPLADEATRRRFWKKARLGVATDTGNHVQMVYN